MTTQTSNTPATTNLKKDNHEYIISLSYIPSVEILRRRLEKLKIKTFFSYKKNLGSYFNRSLKPQSKSVIYQIFCECGSVQG